MTLSLPKNGLQLLNLSLLSFSPALAQEPEPERTPREPNVMNTASSEALGGETPQPLKESLPPAPEVNLLDSHTINIRNFEQAVSFISVPGDGGEQNFYRFDVRNGQGINQLPAEESFLVVGPVTGDAQIQRVREWLIQSGFYPEERVLSRFFGDDLSPTPPEPAVGVGQTKSPGDVFFPLVMAGLLAFSLAHILRNRFKASGPPVILDGLEHTLDETLDDVGGMPQVVHDARDLVDKIKSYRAGEYAAGNLPRGILLEGVPGAGKTLLARAIAGEVDCPFLSINTGQIVASRWAGDASKAILNVFEQARRARDRDTTQIHKKRGKHTPGDGVVIIFFDEFDTVGAARTSGGEQGNLVEYNHLVNALLQELDGVDQNKNRGIVVLAATNFAATLDPALKRPGRLEVWNVPTPSSADERRDILERQAQRLVYDEGCTFTDERPFEYLSKITMGDTGAYLAGMLRYAVELAKRECTTIIEQKHLLEAFQRQKFGQPQPNTLSRSKLEIVARHEHGHALIALACGMDPVVVSMKKRGDTPGRVVMDLNDTLESPTTLQEIMTTVLVQLGGRAAEVHHYGETGATNGSHSDLTKARDLILHAANSGLLLGIFSEDARRGDPLSERMTRVLDFLIGDGITRARTILQQVPSKLLNTLTEDLLNLERELVGAEAKAFYTDRISAEVLNNMVQAAALCRSTYGIAPPEASESDSAS